MSDVQVRPFRRADRDQLTQLVNAHAEGGPGREHALTAGGAGHRAGAG